MTDGYVKHIKLFLTWLAVSLIFLLSIMFLYRRIDSILICTDFIMYWSAGRLLLEGQNPYSLEKIWEMQQSVGWTVSMPLPFYNPPWALPFVLPFCMQDYVICKFLWFFFLLGLVFVCSAWAWRFYGGSERFSLAYLLLVCTFAPVIFMLQKGQIVPLIMLGVLGFLHFQKNRNDWLSGCFLALLAIKPHMLYLFWIALFFWILERRKWSVFIGCLSVTSLAALIAMTYNSELLSQFIFSIKNHTPSYMFVTPTIGTLLRMLFGTEKHWIQFLPSLCGILWLFYYWIKHRGSWSWDQQMPMVIFVSLMTNFYVWVNDYALLILPMAQVVVGLFQLRPSRFYTWMSCLYLSINGLSLIIALVIGLEFYFFWLIPALFTIYLMINNRLEWA